MNKKEEIQIKLYKKLKDSDWADLLKSFILSEEFEKIIEFLITQSSDDDKFTPPLKDIFNAFETCNLKDLKIVLIGGYPFLNPAYCDGIAYSHPSSCKRWHNINRCFRKTLGIKNFNLSFLAKQGILMINNPLTTSTKRESLMHLKAWKPFIVFLIDMLKTKYPDMTWILLEQGVQLSPLLKGQNVIKCLSVSEPSKEYESSISKILTEKGIVWEGQ